MKTRRNRSAQQPSTKSSARAQSARATPQGAAFVASRVERLSETTRAKARPPLAPRACSAPLQGGKNQRRQRAPHKIISAASAAHSHHAKTSATVLTYTGTSCR